MSLKRFPLKKLLGQREIHYRSRKTAARTQAQNLGNTSRTGIVNPLG
jgi:hypothetical protein